MIIPVFNEVRRQSIQPPGYANSYNIGNEEDIEVGKIVSRGWASEHDFIIISNRSQMTVFIVNNLSFTLSVFYCS